MATTHRDYLGPARASQAGAHATYELFKKAWGTTTIDGIEVYNEKLTYWDGSVKDTVRFKRFINKIGVSHESLKKQEYDGLDDAYFALNSAKYSYSPMGIQDIANDLNQAFDIGDEFEVAVTYGGDLKRYVTTHWSTDAEGNHDVDTVAIRAMLNSDKIKYFANAKTEAAGVQFQDTDTNIYDINPGNNKTTASTPVTTISYKDKLYDTLALIDDGTTFEQQGEVYSERVTGVETTDQYGNINIVGEYRYTVKYKVIAEVYTYSNIVDQCTIVATSIYNSLHPTSISGQSYYQYTNHVMDTMIKQAVLLMDTPTTTGAFYKGYLRVDYCASIKKKAFVKLLIKVLDTGYHKTPTEWWQKAIAIVIIIIAIVIIALTWYTPGAALGVQMLALGAGLLYGSVFLTIALMIYAKAFPYATDQIRLIGTAAQIVGYAAMVVGAYNQITSAYFQIAAEIAKELGAEQKWVLVIQLLGLLTMRWEMSNKMMEKAAAEQLAREAGSTAEEIAAAGLEAFNSTGLELSEVVSSITDLPGNMLDSISNIDMGSMLTDVSPTSMGQVSGWMKNMDMGMQLYSAFFITPYVPNTGSEDQADKEDGVEEYYATIAMIDNTDVLDRMSEYKNNMFGGQVTENYLSRTI